MCANGLRTWMKPRKSALIERRGHLINTGNKKIALRQCVSGFRTFVLRCGLSGYDLHLINGNIRLTLYPLLSILKNFPLSVWLGLAISGSNSKWRRNYHVPRVLLVRCGKMWLSEIPTQGFWQYRLCVLLLVIRRPSGSVFIAKKHSRLICVVCICIIFPCRFACGRSKTTFYGIITYDLSVCLLSL